MKQAPIINYDDPRLYVKTGNGSLKLSEFQLGIMAGYIRSYVRAKKNIEKITRENETEKCYDFIVTHAILLTMVRLLTNKHRYLDDEFDHIDFSSSNMLEQIRAALEKFA